MEKYDIEVGLQDSTTKVETITITGELMISIDNETLDKHWWVYKLSNGYLINSAYYSKCYYTSSVNFFRTFNELLTNMPEELANSIKLLMK